MHPMSVIKRLLIALILAAAMALPSSRAAADATSDTVIWISIDGFRHDYLQRIKPPTLSRLAGEGAWTHDEIPIFPSLTFPNHIAQATGVAADKNGIPMNTFFDTATGQTYSLPDDSSLLRAEPIWVTARRQGVGVAVIDWPMSHKQTGPWKSDYFADHFDVKETDAHRLQSVAKLLDSAKNPRDLRLIMSYVRNVDTVGHRYGPDSPRIGEAVLQADSEIGDFLQSAIKWFDATHTADDQFYVLITTDHGMHSVSTLVNLERLLGAELSQGARVVPNAPIASIYLSNRAPDALRERIAAILSRLKTVPFLHAWRAADVPPEFHYADSPRIGDVVVLLVPGYGFTPLRFATTRPSLTEAGMHGYDPAVPEMRGAAILWHYHHPMNGLDLGPVVNTQWHATVARLLGIKPAPGSDQRPIGPLETVERLGLSNTNSSQKN
jgi:predicted AlkP superfamily pyrophosphatase or phosphodiesterase